MTRNHTTRIPPAGGLAAVLALLALAAPVAGQGLLDTVTIHGFGGWAYGETDRHMYLVGTEGGRYDNAEFALNIAAEPMPNLSIVAQLRGEAVAGQDNFEVDYAFAGYAFSDAFNLRIGRVKHPFGIYGEIFDVGTLRPFYTLPQSIYGPNGNTARAYNGVGIAGSVDLGPAWELRYDLYGGQIEGDYTVAGVLLADTLGDPALAFVPKVDANFHVDGTIGARLNVVTPVDGLRFGLSGYSGDDTIDIVEGDTQRRDVLLATLEYLNAQLWLRAEWVTVDRANSYESHGGYLEAAYKLSDHWQVAARWDTYDVTAEDLDVSAVPPFVLQLLEHEEASLGVNYWFGANLVVRLSYHRVDGNTHTYLETPEQILEMLITGELERRTNLVVLGAQFSF